MTELRAFPIALLNSFALGTPRGSAARVAPQAAAVLPSILGKALLSSVVFTVPCLLLKVTTGGFSPANYLWFIALGMNCYSPHSCLNPISTPF